MILTTLLIAGAVASYTDAEKASFIAELEGDADHACLSGDFEINGRYTGQNIDMDYGRTSLRLDTSEATAKTMLDVWFLVPKIYTTQYEAAAFAITFNRDLDLTEDVTHNDVHKDAVDQTANTAADTVTSACYTNRYSNMTDFCHMDGGGGANGWTTTDNGENECMSDVFSSIPWADVMGNAFANVEEKDNGNFWEIFMTATVETWSHFREGYDRDTPIEDHNYVGQMQGNVELSNNPDGNGADFTGRYSGDGGKGTNPPVDPVYDFGPLLIDDERYTMYQIPFIIRFPKTIIVETQFVSASPLVVVVGVVKQDTINVNLNPQDDEVFAELEVTVRTEVQYPYAVSSPMPQAVEGDDTKTMMTACVLDPATKGDEFQGCDTSTDKLIRFVDYWNARRLQNVDNDELVANQGAEQTCGGLKQGEYCYQDFKLRITPGPSNPCTVAGDYLLNYWVECVINPPHLEYLEGEDQIAGGVDKSGNACPIDDMINEDDLADRKLSNAYFETVFTVDHQSFCPEIMDEVRVVGDFRVYHDEGFTQEIYHPSQTLGAPTEAHQAFTNDVLFYEATYRTASATVYGADTFEDNDRTDLDDDDATNPTGDDTIIDYIRATLITAEVSLNKGIDGVEIDDAFEWGALHTTPMISGDAEYTVDAPGRYGPGQLKDGTPDIVALNTDGDNFAKYLITLCKIEEIDPATIEEPVQARGVEEERSQTATVDNDMDLSPDIKAKDCFYANPDDAADTNVGSTANDYLDFDKVIFSSSTGEANENTIDENEVAFKMRLDERIIPVVPETDGSFMKVTISAEVFYKGNLHPTRRLLQIDPTAAGRVQSHTMDTAFFINRRGRSIEKCLMDPKAPEAMIKLQIIGQAESLPNVLTGQDYARTLSMQLNTFMNVDAFSVHRVQTCAPECVNVVDSGFDSNRRLQELDEEDEPRQAHVNVWLKVESTKVVHAGYVANHFQDMVAEEEESLMSSVSAFQSTSVHRMTVMAEGCTDGEVYSGPEVAANDHLRDPRQSSHSFILDSASPSLSLAFGIVFALIASLL